MDLLTTQKKDEILLSVKEKLASGAAEIIHENKRDLDLAKGLEKAMYDRLVINDKKMCSMIEAIEDIVADADPVGVDLYKYDHPNGMKVTNKTAPFGTVLIKYESRPDVTIEAAMVAFKSNNKILLKGGKEAIYSNRALVACWHQALEEHGLSRDWVQLLELDRAATQTFLRSPTIPLDLIVPRGGEGLINFVKTHATCPVLISGRGNNFLYVHQDAEIDKTVDIIVNSKIDKISACNALDKVIIDKKHHSLEKLTAALLTKLAASEVEVLADHEITSAQGNGQAINLEDQWPEEYLAMKIAVGLVDDVSQAIGLINQYSGGHSATIMTEDHTIAQRFMDEVDAAAVYHNVSTRFTDGGQFGLGAELAISTDKLHHRGPLGLHQLVTNKWYIHGDGQTR